MAPIDHNQDEAGPGADPTPLASAVSLHVLRSDAGRFELIGPFSPAPSSSNEAVAIPDFAFQAAVPLPDDAQRAVHRSVFDRLGPGLDVRVDASRGRDSVGAWLTPATGAAIDAARDRGVEELDLAAGCLFGFFLSADLVGTLANGAWQVQPKTLRDDGRPVHGGPVHLESLSITLERPNRVVTEVQARTAVTWPATSFTVTVVDELEASGQITCASTTTADKPAYIGSIGTAAGLPGLSASLAGRLSPEPLVGGGAGSAMASLLPTQFLTSREKFVLYYESVEVSSIGAVFRGTPIATAREPRAWVRGKDRYVAMPGSRRLSATYGLWASDLRPEGLRVHWDGDAEFRDPASPTTSVTFDVGNRGYSERVIRVDARDTDGFEATAELVVVISALGDPADPAD